MKTYKVYLINALVAVLICALFSFGRAYASTGCFTDTNGHWAETFICWMKDNGISSGYPDGTFRPDNSISRAEVAVLLQKQAQLPPSTGLITISEGFGNWRPWSSSSPLVFTYYSGSTAITRTAAGSDYISIHPGIPTVLYGKSLQLVGVEFCYSASATAYLSYLEINVPLHTSGAGSQDNQYYDSTDYTTAACHYYVLSTPVTLTVENAINMFIYITWTNTSTSFSVGRTTFVLQPTGTTAALPAEITGMDVITLQEGSSGSEPATNP